MITFLEFIKIQEDAMPIRPIQGHNGWTAQSTYSGDEGSGGVISFNGKQIAKYEYDRDSNAFWLSDPSGSGQKAFNELGDVVEFLKNKMNLK